MKARKTRKSPPSPLPSPPVSEKPRLLPWNPRWDGWIVLGAALAVRLIYFFQIRANDPFFGYTLDGFDQDTYQEQARLIRDGDLLLSRWTRFYYTPLYAYFCFIVYSIGGWENFDLLHLVQGLLGAITCWLLWALARRYLTRGEALLASALAIACRPWMFYEQLLLVEGISLFSNILVLYLLSSIEAGDRGHRWRLFFAGAASGLAYLARGNFLVLALAWPVWLFFRLCYSKEAPYVNWRKAVVTLGLFVLGLGIVLGPMGWRNYKVAGVIAFGTTNGPALLYLGNAIDATGMFEYSPKFNEAHALSGSDPGIYMRMMRADFRQDPIRIIRHLFYKLYQFWNHFDIPDNTSIYIGKAFAGLMRVTPVTAQTLFVLGLLGAIFSLRRLREESMLWIDILLFSLSIVIILPIGRYRIPIFGVMMIFGARALSWGWTAWRERQWGRLSLGLALMGLLIVLTRPYPDHIIRPQDYRTFLLAARAQNKRASGDRLAAGILRDFPEIPLLRNHRFLYFIDVQSWDEAREEAKTVRSFTPLDVDVAVGLARLEFHEGHAKRAKMRLDAIIEKYPTYEPALQALREVEASEPPKRPEASSSSTL